MKCRKCGANIQDSAKFCEYCGSLVEIQNQISDNLESTPVENMSGLNSTNNIDLEKTVVVEPAPIQSMDSNMQTGINLDVNNSTLLNQSSAPNLMSNNKKNNKMLLIFGGIILAVIAVVVVVFAYIKSSSSSVEILEKAISNLLEKSNNSFTIDGNVSLTTSAGESMSLSATIMSEKKSDNKLDMLIKVNKSLFFDEINLYASIDEKEIALYMQSTLIDMLGTTESLTPVWVRYIDNFDEVLELENYDKSFDNINLKDIIDKKHFIYVDEKDGMKHYQIVIDQELVDSMKSKLELIVDEDVKSTLESMEILDKPIKFDFYINKADELSKIQFDMSEHLIDTEELSSFVMSMEFSGLSNTKVEIPSDAKNSIVDLETYMTTNAKIDYDYDFDYDYDYDFEY